MLTAMENLDGRLQKLLIRIIQGLVHARRYSKTVKIATWQTDLSTTSSVVKKLFWCDINFFPLEYIVRG